jgi:methionyl-tRNA synthetase
MNDPKPRVVITSAPPNPNGDLHLGHLSGPFLGADVLSRYLRQTGHDVSYVGYCDDYSCYVPRRGEELGLGAYETAHLFGDRMQQTLALANMSHDYFAHPLREPLHKETVQRFFGELWESGAFQVLDLPAYWCDTCDRYLYEAEMRGLCQHCAAPADGFYCEECGLPQDTAGLAEAFCTRCKNTPETRRLQRIVFPLEDYRERLREFYDGRPMRPRLREYLDDMLSRPLPLTTVSREADYGVPVPLPEWEGHILDTWYSGIWGYLAATRSYAHAVGGPQAPDGLEAWTDPTTRVYEFIGFDCSFSHALLWPALFLAHGGVTLPDQVVTNEFYRLEGDKFSTSRNHAIWGNEYLRRVPADQLRFYLCLTGPERVQTNFQAADFRENVNRILVDGLQVWLDSIVARVNDDFAGTVPAAGGGDHASAFAKQVGTLRADVAAVLEPDVFSPQAAAQILREAVEFGHGDLAELDALRTAEPEQYAAALAEHVELIASLAVAAAPLMPSFSQLIWTSLGLEFTDPVRKLLPWPSDATRLVPAGSRIAPALPRLFQTVES